MYSPPERSVLQTRLNEIHQYSNLHQLKINRDKTKIMTFNPSYKYDFLPKLFIGDDQLEVVKSVKILGIHLTSDMRWNEHTEKSVKKAKKKLWYLRRLSKLGASESTLIDIFHKVIRSTLEQGAPIFSGGLTKTNSEGFESVQKSAFKIILRGKYHDYDNALDHLEQSTLEVRRQKMSLKFAKKCIKHPKMKHLFRKGKNLETRRGVKFMEPKYKTDRSNNGPIPYLIRLLNGNY